MGLQNILGGWFTVGVGSEATATPVDVHDAVIGFVEPAQGHGTEEDGPEAGADLLEPMG